jgi:hypothetical protein
MMKSKSETLIFIDNMNTIKTNFFVVMIIMLLITSPALTGGIYYVDDYYRVLNGNIRYWFFNGRPLAVFLTWLLDLSSITTDTSPLPLLTGLIVCGMLLIISFRKLPELPDSMSILLSLSVLVSPFLAQGMLYAFDSMAILISTGLAIYGVTVASRVSARPILTAFLILLATLCLYQPSINYSLMLIFIIFILTCENVDALKLLILRLSILFMALIMYKMLIIPLSGMDSLSMQRGEIISFNTAGLLKLYNNIDEALHSITIAFPGLIRYPLAFILLTGISACIFRFWQRIRGGEYMISGLVILSPFLIMLCIPGFLLLLKNSRFDPRVLGAFSTAVIFFFCISYHTFVILRKTLIGCLILYIVFSAAFMTTLFRAAVNQDRFNEDIIVSIRNLLSLFPSNSVTGVSFIGASPYSPDVLPSLRRYPYLRHYFTPAFTENNEFRYYGPARRVMLYFPLNKTTQAMKDYIPVKKLSFGCIFHLYTYDSTAVINFSMPACHIPLQYMHLPPRAR